MRSTLEQLCRGAGLPPMCLVELQHEFGLICNCKNIFMGHNKKLNKKIEKEIRFLLPPVGAATAGAGHHRRGG